MSCGEVWKYHAIFPVSTLTAIERAREQVVSLASHAGVAGSRIARAEDVELGLGIVDARNPRLPAAMPRGLETRPGVETGIARLHRHGIELPLQLAGFGIVRLEEAGQIEVVAGADQHVVANDDRRHGGKVLLVEVAISTCQRSLPVFASSETR